MRLLSILCVIALAGLVPLLPACGSLPDPVFLEEVPVESDNWVPVAAQPTWVTAPTAKDGTRRFVESGKSNLRKIVVTGRRPLASRFLEMNVAQALTPLIGADAAETTAQDVLAKLVLVKRACREEVLTRKMVPGNTLCTAWALWELPLDPSVATVPEEHREAARRLLSTIDLTSRPQ